MVGLLVTIIFEFAPLLLVPGRHLGLLENVLFISAIIPFAVLGIPFAYVLGGVPALFTGCVVAAYVGRYRRLPLHVAALASTALGTLMFYLGSFAKGQWLRDEHLQGRKFTVVCLVAGIACAIVIRKRIAAAETFVKPVDRSN